MFLKFEELLDEIKELKAKIDDLYEKVKYIYDGIYGRDEDDNDKRH